MGVKGRRHLTLSYESYLRSTFAMKEGEIPRRGLYAICWYSAVHVGCASLSSYCISIVERLDGGLIWLTEMSRISRILPLGTHPLPMPILFFFFFFFATNRACAFVRCEYSNTRCPFIRISIFEILYLTPPSVELIELTRSVAQSVWQSVLQYPADAMVRYPSFRAALYKPAIQNRGAPNRWAIAIPMR